MKKFLALLLAGLWCLSSQATPVRSAIGANSVGFDAAGDGIIPVEYLESTGTQWIDTGIIFKTHPRVVFDWMDTSGTDRDVCGNKTKANGCFIIDLYLNNNTWLWYFYKKARENPIL